MKVRCTLLAGSLLAGMIVPTALCAQPAPPPGAPEGMPAMPAMADTKYTALLEIADGALAANQGSQNGAVSATDIAGVTISSAAPATNAVIVRGGRSAVTLRGSSVSLSGPGTNDFLGTGAGVLVRDRAAAVLIGDTIETSARVSSALVAAENATVRVYGSHLTAHGGPLPEGYKPRIGPGMLEPPAPLGLSGTARTVLAMSNSRTFLHDSVIEADGWGALSTDATGGNLYLEANDCVVKVSGKGYGAYADFGAHVVLNRTVVESGSDVGIIAGKARIDLNQVKGESVRSGVMIHSVMAFDPTETAELNLTGTVLSAQGPVFLVKSANAAITVKGGALSSASGVLLEVRRNDDPNATKTGGKPVPGVVLALDGTTLSGDVLDSDPERTTTLDLAHATLKGKLAGVTLRADAGSHWAASADSSITLAPGTRLSVIDAASGVTVTLHGRHDATGGQTLPGGGQLVFAP